jgi:formyltetrahydrofolate-dependent phosphoribosylglycinamide formyltransferase
MTRIAILVGAKGRGSNMIAIAEACERNDLLAECCVVVSPVHDSAAVQAAEARRIPVAVVDPNVDGYDQSLLSVAERHRSDLVCLAGYTRLLPSPMLAAFPNAVLNIHPALLPKYGGKGFYGKRVHEAVIAAGESETGCTVHFVTENYDEGEILLSMRCPVHVGDLPEDLAARVLALEHQCYVKAIAKWIEIYQPSRNASR